jgi:hypothetical protein
MCWINRNCVRIRFVVSKATMYNIASGSKRSIQSNYGRRKKNMLLK